MSVFDMSVSVLIAALTVVFIVTVAPKIIMRQVKNGLTNDLVDSIFDHLEVKIKKDAEDWLNSEKGQQALYQIGVLVGNGAKSGFGLAKGGKFGFKDILMQAAGGLLQNGGLKSLFSPAEGTPAAVPQKVPDSQGF
jgi:hypothetical protein